MRNKIKIHFVGIGGIGMSGIAEILLYMGYEVSGSDIADSQNTKKLRSLGSQVFIGHDQKNIDGATILVYSSAVDDLNPEIREAKKKKIPLMKRAEMLAELMRLKKGIAIAGTHGKTTTTSFLATLLQEGGYGPTYAIGGIVSNLEGHAKVGEGAFLVAEADESDGSFLLLHPILSVITNIDDDHLSFYGSKEKLIKAFEEFANKIPFYGVCAINYHDVDLRKIMGRMKKPYLSFGIVEDIKTKADIPDIGAVNIKYSENASKFDLFVDRKNTGEILINLPGRHNVLNALGAISIALELELSVQVIKKAIGSFRGVERRFQTLYKKGNLEIIDDYGHHPTEITETLKTLKETRTNNKLIVFFEPHRYTRTRDCWDSFLHCFNQVDKVFLLPIYPASKKEIVGISSDRLEKDINKLHPGLMQQVCYDQMDTLANKKYKKQTTIITMGAGNIGKKIREIISGL